MNFTREAVETGFMGMKQMDKYIAFKQAQSPDKCKTALLLEVCQEHLDAMVNTRGIPRRRLSKND